MGIFNKLLGTEEKNVKGDMTKEVGVEGDVVVGSFDNEEQRKDKISIKDYRKMFDTDETVEALYNVVTLPILATSFDVVADEADVDGEQANFIRNCLFQEGYRGGMETPFSLFLDQTLKAVMDGFAVFERVYRLDSQGRLVYKKLAYRDSTTVTMLRDGEKNYAGINQKATFADESIDVDIPAYKTFLFTFGKAHDYLYGRSGFKSIYGSYDRKRKMEYFDLVSIQARAKKARILRRIADEAVKVQDENDGTVKRALKKLQKLGEYSSVAYVPSGYEVDEMNSDQLNANESIERQNSGMARKFLAQFILLGNQGSASVGSYALSADQSDLFMIAEKGVMKLLAEHFTRYLIVDLIDLNYPVGKRFYPTFKFGDISEEMQEFIKAVFTKMVEKDRVSDTMLDGLEQKVAARMDIDLSKKPDKPVASANETKDDKKEDDGQTAAKFPDIEDVVNLSAIEKWSDKTAKQFEQRSTEILTPYFDDVAKNPDAAVELPVEYVELLTETYRKAYNYGKLTASDELDEKAPKTTQSEADHVQKFLDFIVTKQTADIEAMIAGEKMKVPASAHEDGDDDSEPNLLTQLITAAGAILLSQIILGTTNTIVNQGLSSGRSDAFAVLADDKDLHMWVSALEKNTCATCRALNGTTYNAEQWAALGYVPGYVHISCRCIEAVLRNNSGYTLPDPTGAPDNLDTINKIQVTRKADLQKQGLIGADQTKVAALKYEQYNKVSNGKTLQEVENATRSKSVEFLSAWDAKGNKLAEITDNSTNSVGLSDDFIKYLKDKGVAVVSHNHPGSSSFSAADIDVARVLDLNEIRAISQKYDYSMKKGSDGWPSKADIFSTYEELIDAAYAKADYLVSTHKITQDEANLWIFNETISGLAKEFMLQYSRKEL